MAIKNQLQNDFCRIVKGHEESHPEVRVSKTPWINQTEALDKPEAKVVPTPLRLVRVEIACSTLGNLRKALRVSVCTAFGVLMRTRLVNCGKNFPRCKNRHSFFYNCWHHLADFYTKMFSIEQYTEVS